mgnify:CR=1 FL=1
MHDLVDRSKCDHKIPSIKDLIHMIKQTNAMA